MAVAFAMASNPVDPTVVRSSAGSRKVVKPGSNNARQLKPILKCVWNSQTEQFDCVVQVYVDENLPEEVIVNERIDITPGGWGVDPTNGNCSDCMTPYPQYEGDPPEPVLDEFDYCGNGEYDERDLVRAEYVTIAPGLGWVPVCSDFATTGGTAHFTWNALSLYPGNEHKPLAIITAATALENTRVAYGYSVVVLSGYRCPNGNYNTPGASATSRHMRGDAFDIRWDTVNGPWVQAEFNALKTTALANGFTQGLDWDSYGDHHLHVDKGGGS